MVDALAQATWIYAQDTFLVPSLYKQVIWKAETKFDYT